MNEHTFAVRYQHEPHNTETVYLGLGTRSTAPKEEAWKPAYRDTIGRRRVVFADFPEADAGSELWLRDSAEGDRRVKRFIP